MSDSREATLRMMRGMTWDAYERAERECQVYGRQSAQWDRGLAKGYAIFLSIIEEEDQDEEAA
jgi:hypothetical protein